MNLTRIKKQGMAGKKYIFFRDGKTQYVIPNKYSKRWWEQATKSDINRVKVR